MVQEGPSLSLSSKIVFQEVPIYWAPKKFQYHPNCVRQMCYFREPQPP
jgi:hypothetical protein